MSEGLNVTNVTHVLLTDSDNVTMLVECPDHATAERVAAAAVFSDGGVSAWLVPTEPDYVTGPTITGLRRIADLLREGRTLDDVKDSLSSHP